MSWWNDAANWVGEHTIGAIGDAASSVGGKIRDAYNTVTADPGADAERRRKQLLQQQAQQAGYFAGQSQGSYQKLGEQGQSALDALRAQALGANSVSQEQIRQNLGQLLAQQRSLAAGASPRNAALAARTAAIQSGRLGAGLAGQQALAGLQERNQAQQQYAGLLQGLRGQDLNATLGSRQTAITGYGAGNAGAPEKSWLEKYGPAFVDTAGAIAKLSDRALKTDIKPGDAKANAAIDALKPYTYTYKDQQYGSGPQFGTMTDDLKRAGLGQSVVRTPVGEAINPGALSSANTAMIAALGRRVAELEGAKGGKPATTVPAAPPKSIELVEVNPRSPASANYQSDPAAWAAQAQLDARRPIADQAAADAARSARIRQQVYVEQTDPAAARAQYALNARRALLAEMAARQAAAPAPSAYPPPLYTGMGRGR